MSIACKLNAFATRTQCCRAYNISIELFASSRWAPKLAQKSSLPNTIPTG